MLAVASLEPLRPESSLEDVSSHLAAYNMVAGPVVDEDGHLVGVVTVDDVLDHLLPADWRERDRPTQPPTPEAARGA